MVVVVSTNEDVRARAMREYIVLRHADRTREQALAEIRTILPSEPITAWEQQDNWELAFRAVAGSSLLTSDALRPDTQLQALIRRRAQVDDILAELHDRATDPANDVDSIELRDKARGEYMRYSTNRDQLQDRIDALTSSLSTHFAENNALPKWKQQREEILQDLHRTYAGKGTQYELLCERLASSVVMSRQIEASPGSVDMKQYTALQDATTKFINQLQKYTEATKSETIRAEVQEAMVDLLRIVESHMGAYPELWHEIVLDVVQRAGGQIIEGEVKELDSGVHAAEADE